MTRFTPIFVLLLLTISACGGSQEATTTPDTGPTLDIEAPPSGSLSDSQLEAIAEDIRRLEVRPLAAGADEARSNLLTWIQGSPDVSITLCEGVTGGLVRSGSRYRGELFAQFIFSNAAYRIEHPDADRVAANVAGLEGALAAYRTMKAQGDRARDAFMESISERSSAGSLRDYVRSGLADC